LVWSVLRTFGGNLQPVMGTPLASGAALPRRACLRSRGDTVIAGSGRTSHNAADAPLQSTRGGTRSGTPWTGRSRRSGEDASQPHNKGLELRHEIADPHSKGALRNLQNACADASEIRAPLPHPCAALLRLFANWSTLQ